MQFLDETKEKYTTEQVFAEHLALIVTNIPAWVNLFTEDAVIEFPYASGTAKRLEGKEAIYNYMKDVPAQMQNLIFTNICKYPTSNPNLFWAEVHGETIITATGRYYQQDYVMRLETKEGKFFTIANIGTSYLLLRRGVAQKICTPLSMKIAQS